LKEEPLGFSRRECQYVLNVMNNSILVSGQGDHWYEWSLSIPGSAPSDIYYDKVVDHFGSGYLDQTMWATFQIDQFPAAGAYNGAGVFYGMALVARLPSIPGTLV
jgi:hypothetical protein